MTGPGTDRFEVTSCDRPPPVVHVAGHARATPGDTFASNPSWRGVKQKESWSWSKKSVEQGMPTFGTRTSSTSVQDFTQHGGSFHAEQSCAASFAQLVGLARRRFPVNFSIVRGWRCRHYWQNCGGKQPGKLDHFLTVTIEKSCTSSCYL